MPLCTTLCPLGPVFDSIHRYDEQFHADIDLTPWGLHSGVCHKELCCCGMSHIGVLPGSYAGTPTNVEELMSYGAISTTEECELMDQSFALVPDSL
jgi:hypothetical protein